MIFAKPLRERVRNGEITSSVRIWKQARVKVGGRYAMHPGSIVVEAVTEIEKDDINLDLARRSGFETVDDLLEIAQHGTGDRVFVVDFRYEETP